MERKKQKHLAVTIMYVLVFTTNAVLSIVVVMELGYDDDGCARI